MGYSETRETKSNLYNQAKSSTMRAKDVLEMLQAKTDFFTGSNYLHLILEANLRFL